MKVPSEQRWVQVVTATDPDVMAMSVDVEAPSFLQDPYTSKSRGTCRSWGCWMLGVAVLLLIVLNSVLLVRIQPKLELATVCLIILSHSAVPATFWGCSVARICCGAGAVYSSSMPSLVVFRTSSHKFYTPHIYFAATCSGLKYRNHCAVQQGMLLLLETLAH